MTWWRRRPEVRVVGGYTETQLLDQFTRAIAGNVRHVALGGLQCAAGAVARAFAAAEVEGDNGLLDLLTRYEMGHDLITLGQSVWLLDAGRGWLRLSRAATSTNVSRGGPSSDDWLYTLTAAGPSTTTTVRAPASRVVHVRHNTDPSAPWRGRSALTVAQSSGGLASTLVNALTVEGEIPTLRIIPQPFGQSQPAADSILAAVNGGLRLALPETTASGGGAGRSSAPLTDWKSYTIQPEYMAGGVQLHTLALQETAGVCGLPAPMVPGSAAAGPAWREAYRQFLTITVQPLGMILQAEVSRVLELPVRLTYNGLAGADVAGRARAFSALRDGDVDRDRALELVGWS